MKKYNQYYLENKSSRTKIAQQHTEMMDSQYADEISECVKNTRTYSGLSRNIIYSDSNKEHINISVIEKDTVSALFEHSTNEGKTAILNFASYKYPGGGFMVGSRAQEESLCHESFLYNVLREFEKTYYIENQNSINKGLYRNRALYSPNVRFIRDGKQAICDVVTCAAPNFSAASRHITREINNQALAERIRFILEIAKKENVNTFIVGAWGCGVFQQDPKTVAKCFKEEVQKVFFDAPINLVFAVIPPLPNQTDNLTPFVELSKDWNN